MFPKLAKIPRSERFIEVMGRDGVIRRFDRYDYTRLNGLNWNVMETEDVDDTRNDLGPEGEQWRLRHYAYIFPSLTVKETEDRKLDCQRNVLRPKENITESRVRRREQIKYEHVARCIPGLDVYNITNSCQVLQYFYTHGEKPVIPTSLADTPCVDLGVDGLLENINRILCTSYHLTPPLSYLFESYIEKCYDFGTVYATLRPLWHDHGTINMKLRRREKCDKRMRKEVLVDRTIINRLVPPRRVWDLYSNRVVPWWAACQNPWAISHAWMDEKDRKPVLTPINGRRWPVPIPKDTDLDLIRIEMLNLGAEYVWLDVLCLRQTGGEEEGARETEWKVDVPTIGRVYEMAERVIWYFCGLGRPFTVDEHDLESERSWFRRAWTLQEISKHPIIGGVTIDNAMVYEMMPFKFRKQLLSLEKIAQRVFEQTDVFAILSHMRTRLSTKKRDKIAGLAYLLRPDIIPAYYEAQSEEDAWTVLVNVISHDYKAPMLFLYPEPGNGNEIWRPSWDQVMKGSLPRHDPNLLHDAVTWNQETNTNSYRALVIESALVRGLDREGKRGMSRRGELVVKDRFTERDHRFTVVATHQYLIAEGWYTIFSSCNRGLHSEDSRYWVCGRRLPGPKNMFEKVSVFQMPYYVDAERLRTLRIAEPSHVVLA
ncbi:uncharacterized protein ARMOST_21491 [Armillaria ostoyae]|uniref:Heterokaryon incompatibility domain-containing protein n=1 Tax=Armillaria ostoyae TaxID=47428 RepID=A0A284SA99_ARMOS|nr:uncharacterized protein ARMOST_21491 [Armillaria ostoyae]